MEELTIEQKTKRYDEAIEIIKKCETDKYGCVIGIKPSDIFPELEVLDDEKIRKEIIKFLELPHPQFVGNRKHKEWIAWLEKQVEQNPTQETESFEAEHGKYYYCIKDYFCGGKKQASKGDVIQALRGMPIMGLKDVSEYFLPVNFIKCYRAWSKEDERIYQSIMDDTVQENQLDDKQTEWLSNIKYRYFPQPNQEWGEENEEKIEFLINLIRFQVKDSRYSFGYGDNVTYVTKEEILDWLKSLKDRIQSKPSNKPQGKTALEAIKEEKVDNANKIESKFKVGDWVVRKDGKKFRNDYKFAQITEIDGEKYWFDTGLIYFKAEDIRLWALEDAEDGDILYSKKHNLIWRYKNTKECYFCINLNYNSNNISIGDVIVIPNDVRPATKEQRDLVFDKMLQHIFSEIYDKKELKKQDEHNPTDNVEPKFKICDWISIGRHAILINDIRNDLYEAIFTNGEHRVFETNILDKEGHLWTIADAKDGDVLVASDGSIFIFAGVIDYACKYYVALTAYNGVSVNKEVELGSWELVNHVHPATKEQCDLLFAKMREKGYKWINEKKEVIRRI